MESEVSSILIAAHELKAPMSLIRQLALSLDTENQDSNAYVRSQIIDVSERQRSH